MTITYVDSGVLIAAARGLGPVSLAATAIITDPNRQFISSDFVRLEVLPKPIYHHQTTETDFYRAFFATVGTWVATSPLLAERAFQRAATFGLSAIDAAHIAAAELANADEFVTTEQSAKPMFRVTSLRIVSIHP